MNKDDMLLVLLAGQSNMAGRDVAGRDDLTPVSGLLMLTKDLRWLPAVEPITRDRPFVGAFDGSGKKIVSADPWDNIAPAAGGKVLGVGPGRTFGRLLLETYPSCRVGLIPAAVGGTPVAAWKPGGIDPWNKENHPYDDAVRMAKEAQKSGKIAAVLWHQGETDADAGNPHYKEDLREVILNFRRDLHLGEDVPFLLGELAGFYTEKILALVPEYNRIMHELASELPSVGVASGSGLEHRGDNLHFNTESAHELGRRYFAEYLRLAGKR